tara:strand:+ start:1455 stop:2129 length:675 start_codon:yes stop_codon:yes gene_type:complete
MNNLISIIPLRDGSKGLKNKNTAIIDGEPLYHRTLKQALRLTHKCIINTDIKEVLSQDFGSNVQIYKRDKKYAQDNSEMKEVLIDLFSNINLKDKIIILLQATSPLRSDIDIKKAIEIYNSGNFSIVMSVKNVDPKVLKYGYQVNNEFIPINKKFTFSNRQSLPNIYAPNGAIYIFSVNDFLKNNSLPNNNIGFYEMPYERSIDIDKKEDLFEVNKLISSQNMG